MKNFFKLFGIVALCAIIAVGMISCEGPVGPQGPEGKEGPEGKQGPAGQTPSIADIIAGLLENEDFEDAVDALVLTKGFVSQAQFDALTGKIIDAALEQDDFDAAVKSLITAGNYATQTALTAEAAKIITAEAAIGSLNSSVTLLNAGLLSAATQAQLVPALGLALVGYYEYIWDWPSAAQALIDLKDFPLYQDVAAELAALLFMNDDGDSTKTAYNILFKANCANVSDCYENCSHDNGSCCDCCECDNKEDVIPIINKAIVRVLAAGYTEMPLDNILDNINYYLWDYAPFVLEVQAVLSGSSTPVSLGLYDGIGGKDEVWIEFHKDGVTSDLAIKDWETVPVLCNYRDVFLTNSDELVTEASADEGELIYHSGVWYRATGDTGTFTVVKIYHWIGQGEEDMNKTDTYGLMEVTDNPYTFDVANIKSITFKVVPVPEWY